MQINILKKAHYGKVSIPEKETPTYNIDNSGSDYYFRITDNTSGDYLSHEWKALTTFPNAFRTTLPSTPRP